MKISEFKLRLIRFGNNLIDIYFPGDGIGDRMVSASAKYILKNKINELDPVLTMFSNVDKELDVNEFLTFMKDNMIKDGLRINARDYFPADSQIASFLPNKTLIIKREDLDDLLR